MAQVIPLHAATAAVETSGVGKSFRRSGGGAREVLRLARGNRRPSGRRRVVLHPLDLVVERGSSVGILGVNGSGKSTLVRILSTLLLPDTGTARVFGHDVVRQAAVVRRHVNRVSVEAAFFKELSPWENLLYSARLYGSTSTLRERAEEALRRMGLQRGSLDRPMKQLSRGQQQKVAIARSLLTSPSLLLMDEPTTGLDPRSRREVQAVIAELRGGRDVSIVLCTHDLAEAEVLCDRVVILDAGRLLASGTPAELRASVPAAASLEDVFLRLTGRALEDDSDDAGDEDASDRVATSEAAHVADPGPADPGAADDGTAHDGCAHAGVDRAAPGTGHAVLDAADPVPGASDRTLMEGST